MEFSLLDREDVEYNGIGFWVDISKIFATQDATFVATTSFDTVLLTKNYGFLSGLMGYA